VVVNQPKIVEYNMVVHMDYRQCTCKKFGSVGSGPIELLCQI